MARKFKTFITNLGFFEMAVAAPSMKAALEAWGMGHNTFAHGFAKQTDDPKIVEATLMKPGVVLRRAVGSKVAFTENPSLPTSLPTIKPPASAPVAKPERPKPVRTPAPPGMKIDKAQIISFKKEQDRRERERAKTDAAKRKASEQRRAAVDRAQAAYDADSARHEEILAEIEAEREKLDRRVEAEQARWTKARSHHKAKIAKAVP